MQDNQDELIIEQYLEERRQQAGGRDDIDQELSHKKDYIKRQIVQQYAEDEEKLELFAQHFLQYLRQKKGIQTESHNLDLLSINELQEIVSIFKKKYPRNQLTSKNQEKKNKLISAEISQNYELPLSEQPNMNSWNPKKVYYSNGAWDYELCGYEECKKQKPYFDETNNYKNIVISFLKAETKKSGGFFGIGGSLDLWIQLKMSIMSQSIARTAKDFLFLRRALIKSIPFTFVPPLALTQKMLDSVDSEEIKKAVIRQCSIFINEVCKNEQLLQNFFTFRFFKENKYQNYIKHKKVNQNFEINSIKLLKNIEGCVSIQLSDKNEMIKKDYNRKCEFLQRLWRNVGQSNSKIVTKLKEIQQQIKFQKKQFELVLVDISHSNQVIQSPHYQKVTQVLFCYNDIYKVYSENMRSYQNLFERVNSQLAFQAQKNWKTFFNYKSEVQDYCNQYQVRRKVFLDKQESKDNRSTLAVQKSQKLQKSAVQTVQGQKLQKKQIGNRISIISELGIDDTSEKELIWIERYSKMQAYINHQFTHSFEQLLDRDRQILKSIMQQTAQNVLQRSKIQQKSFIDHLSVISY